MTPAQQSRTIKNLNHWGRCIDKLKARDKLSEAETDELEMRTAQCVVWAHQLKNEGITPDAVDNPGDMSANSSLETGETAKTG